MEAADMRLLREIGLDDVLLLCCSPSERLAIRRLASGGLIELQGHILKRAVITQRGIGLIAD